MFNLLVKKIIKFYALEICLSKHVIPSQICWTDPSLSCLNFPFSHNVRISVVMTVHAAPQATSVFSTHFVTIWLILPIYISRESSLKVGDRILAINEFSVVTLNLAEVYMLLSQCDNLTAFTMEYDISVIGKFEPPIPGPEVINFFHAQLN